MKKEISTPRITMQTIRNYILTVLNLERGLGFTLWQLTIRPGTAIREFLFTEKRKQYIKPISFLILLVSVSSYLIIKAMPQDADSINDSFANSPGYLSILLKDSANILLKYFNLIQMLKIPFLSIGTYYFFKKSKFNFAEHLVLNSYIFGYVTCFLVLVLMISKFFNPLIISAFLVMSLIYPLFVYFKLFNESFFKTFIKSFGIFWIVSIFHTVFIAVGVWILQESGLL